jgi:tRNA 2-thiouridine synthesizing protein A
VAIATTWRENGWKHYFGYNAETAGLEVFMQFNKELDTRGLNCPLPILRTKKAMTDMTPGEVLKIVATDPSAMKDFQAFAKQTGHELLYAAEVNKEYLFLLRKR